MTFLDMWSGKWLVVKSNDIIKWSIIGLLIIVFLYLATLSIIYQDLTYPKMHPWLFAAETLIFSVGSGAVVFLMAYGRGDLNLMTIVEFVLVSLKFGLLHILLQFAGFYSFVFDYDYKKLE